MSDPVAFDKVSLLRLAFKGLSDDELQEMATVTHLSAYPPDHVLCHEGAYEDIFYILADGNAVTTKHISEEEGERVLRMAGRGDFFGEMALIQNAPRSATVRTTTDCTVLEMGKKDFETMLSRSPRMAISIIRSTLDRMRANDQMAIQDLQRTNKILRQLDRNKLEFIQVAAHELRTPLTVLKGYVNVLRSFPEIKTNATLNEVIGGINKGAERMHEVVNMMLDVTRIDSETLKLVAVPVPLRSMINDIARDFAKSAEERTIVVNIDHDPETPNINGDPTLIQKAIYHLIINAIKYTPDGGTVTIRTRPITMERNTAGVEISVRDSGIGLDAEHHELVFEKFYQVGDVAIHSSGKTKFKGGGPGLGLAIVKGVARAHNGKVWVESLGHDEVNFPGSCFYLHLPIHPSQS
ncbi:MAG: cyclic nucleotide-binding domain-containing protein [Chloroflexi bacterium]|nr:cyclic nucleotide-binding domain-containing protein [Chloroflexota bacterium]MBI5082317.1 cyclic nucleotide-binding domain-containing protein [Chloroflexota bacterium]MBI5714176.1 cyclic nucleotide-binding domain-containing protein [Chloroflexota bacterium]